MRYENHSLRLHGSCYFLNGLLQEQNPATTQIRAIEKKVKTIIS